MEFSTTFGLIVMSYDFSKDYICIHFLSDLISNFVGAAVDRGALVVIHACITGRNSSLRRIYRERISLPLDYAVYLETAV